MISPLIKKPLYELTENDLIRQSNAIDKILNKRYKHRVERKCYPRYKFFRKVQARKLLTVIYLFIKDEELEKAENLILKAVTKDPEKHTEEELRQLFNDIYDFKNLNNPNVPCNKITSFHRNRM